MMPTSPDGPAPNSADRQAFNEHFAAHAPDWFRPDEPTMDRLAGAWAQMQEAKAALERARPDVERLVELTAAGMTEVDRIALSIPDEVWNATPDFVDDIEVVCDLVAGSTPFDVMDLGEKMAQAEPAPLPRAEPEAVATTLKAQPPLVADRQARAWPPEAVAVRDARYKEPTPGRLAEFSYWSNQARDDIAVKGVDWAAGHAEGLRVAASLADCSSELAEKVVEISARPDPFAGYSAAWTRYEDEAEAKLAAEAARQPVPQAEATATPTPERVPLQGLGWAHEVEPAPPLERYVPDYAATADLQVQARNVATLGQLAASTDVRPFAELSPIERAMRNFPHSQASIEAVPHAKATRSASAGAAKVARKAAVKS